MILASGDVAFPKCAAIQEEEPYGRRSSRSAISSRPNALSSGLPPDSCWIISRKRWTPSGSPWMPQVASNSSQAVTRAGWLSSERRRVSAEARETASRSVSDRPVLHASQTDCHGIAMKFSLVHASIHCEPSFGGGFPGLRKWHLVRPRKRRNDHLSIPSAWLARRRELAQIHRHRKAAGAERETPKNSNLRTTAGQAMGSAGA